MKNINQGVKSYVRMYDMNKPKDVISIPLILNKFICQIGREFNLSQEQIERLHQIAQQDKLYDYKCQDNF